jgi:hypothetical protein
MRTFTLDELREHHSRLVLRDEWTWFVHMWAIIGLQVTERELGGTGAYPCLWCGANHTETWHNEHGGE